MNGTKERKLQKTDLAAITVFLLLGAALVFSAFYNAVSCDEGYYYTLAQRFFGGDRFLVDDWSLMQLAGLFLLLPYRLFTAVAGGTDGLILFMRLFFIAADLLLYLWSYRKLRKYGAAGVFAAAMPSADLFGGFLAMNYYNLCVHCLWIVAVALLTAEKPLSRPKLSLLGAVFSAAVLCVPQMALIYGLFTVMTLVFVLLEKQGKKLPSGVSFFINGKNWAWVSVGVALSAAVVLIFLSAFSGIRNVVSTLPQLLTDSEHQLSFFDKLFRSEKLRELPGAFGWEGLALSLLTSAAALVLRIKRAGNAPRRAVYALALLSAAYCYLRAALCEAASPYGAYLAFLATYRDTTLPAVGLALSCLLLRKKNEKEMTAMFVFGVVCSLPMDLLSNDTLFYCGRLVWLPAAYCALRLPAELQPADKADGKKKTGMISRILCATVVAAVGFYFVYVIHGYGFLTLRRQNAAGTPAVTIETGPFRGLRANSGFAGDHRNVLADLDAIETTGGVFYVLGTNSYAYLYLDLPMGAYSSYFAESDKMTRTLRYWDALPEKRPDVIYIPYNEFDYISFGNTPEEHFEENVAFVEANFNARRVDGRGGAIMYILD